MRLHRPPSTSLPSYLLSQIQSCLLPLLSIHGPEQRGGRDCSVVARGSGASHGWGWGWLWQQAVARHAVWGGWLGSGAGGGARSSGAEVAVLGAAEHTSRRSSVTTAEGVVALRHGMGAMAAPGHLSGSDDDNSSSPPPPRQIWHPSSPPTTMATRRRIR